jgi:hypothetical protein
MQKIWAKIMRDGKVKKSIIHNAGERIETWNFYDHVRQISEQLKIPTPIVLTTYAENFLNFNLVKFKQRDFLEEIPFDYLLLECAE